MNAFADIDIRATVSASVIETFSSMLSMDIQPLEEEPSPGHGIRRMVGTLNFAGKIIGIFNVQTTFDFGRRMAAALLGMEPEEVESGTEIRDLVAEVTNIVGGNLKSALNDAGYPCVLSTPSITYGTDFSIKSLNMDRFDRFAFQRDDQVVIIEVGLKEQEGADSGIDFSSPDGVSRTPHVDLQKLDALDYESRLADAAVDVFETMFSIRLDRMQPASAAGLDGMRYISSVCFAGDATGIVSLHVSQEMSRLMAANMLGMEPEEVEGTAEIEDMLGELGNIVGGNLKSALTDTGLRCALSTPSFTVGSDFQIESLNLERFERVEFRYGDHFLFVEMGLKISELAKAPAGAAKAAPPRAREPKTPAESETTASPAPASPAAAPPKAATPPAPAAAPPAAPEPGEAKSDRATPEDLGLAMLLDIPVELTVELGRTKMPIHELLKLRPGSAVKLARLEGEPVDILANDVLIARGEVVVRHEKYGIRITEITSRMERLKGLR
jgi:flagellar motor switch protein FliN